MKEFTSIRITKDVAVRFRKISHEMVMIQSEALKALIDLWEKYKGKEGSIEGDRIIKEMVPHIEKNTNRLVGILRSIEKDKINHIHGLIHALFTAGTSKQSSGSLPDPKDTAKPGSANLKFEDAYSLIDLRHQKKTLEWEVKELKKTFYTFLDEKVIVVQQRFQKPRLELNLTVDELNKIKEQYKIK
jgi:hypothetical protein